MNSLKSYIKSVNPVTSFLVLEVLALLATALGGVDTVFYFAAIIIGIIAIPYGIVFSSKEEKKRLLIPAIPLVLAAGLSCFGLLYGGASYFLSNLVTFIAIIAIFFVGYSASKIRSINIGTALLVMGVALAVVTLITLFICWYSYGWFYGLRCKENPLYFFNGSQYDVTAEIQWIYGFTIKETSLEYAGLFGLLLCSGIPALLFIDPKKNTLKFILTAAVGLVGLLSLIFTPNILGLLFLVLILVCATVYKFYAKHKIFRQITNILGILAIVLFVAVSVLVALNCTISSVHNFLSSNGFTNRLFNTNKYMVEVNQIVKMLFNPKYFFGIPQNALTDEGHSALFTETGNFLLEVGKEGGLFAILLLLAFIVIAVLGLNKYLKNSKDKDGSKIVIFTLICVFFIYNLIGFKEFPQVHDDFNVFHVGFLRAPITLVVIFLLGYVARPLGKDIKLLSDDDSLYDEVFKKVENKEAIAIPQVKSEVSNNGYYKDLEKGDVDNENK